MKKLLLYGLITLFGLMCIGCSSFKTQEELEELDVDKIISSDLEYMALNYGENYRWYGVNMLLKEYLDQSETGSVVEAINTFMILSDPEKSYDTNILRIKHTLKGDTIEIIPSLWVEEDVSMNKSDIKLSFKSYNLVTDKLTSSIPTAIPRV